MTSALAVESKCHDPFRHDPQLGQLRPGKRHVVFLPLRCKDSSSRVKTRSTQVNSSSIAQCKIAAVFGAVTLATFFAAGRSTSCPHRSTCNATLPHPGCFRCCCTCRSR
jgi:hypothetical protein